MNTDIALDARTIWADRIRRLRAERGWSQSEFARAIGFPPGIVAQYEMGSILPPPGRQVRIAALAAGTLDTLAGLAWFVSLKGPFPHGGNFLTPEVRQAVRDSLLAGYGLRETSRRTGVTTPSVAAQLHDLERSGARLLCRCGRPLRGHHGSCGARQADPVPAVPAKPRRRNTPASGHDLDPLDRAIFALQEIVAQRDLRVEPLGMLEAWKRRTELIAERFGAAIERARVR